MKKIIAAVLLVSVMLSLSACFGTHVIMNEIDYAHNKIDEATSYKLKKKVEDTCRSMVASYESDKLTWEQYKDSDNDEKQEWAEQAKMRANKTASTYNNYIMENSYVWSDNVPKDIRRDLEYLK